MGRKSLTELKTDELLRDLIIVNAGLAGVSGGAIRAIVGGDMNRVTKILKLLKKRTKGVGDEKTAK